MAFCVYGKRLCNNVERRAMRRRPLLAVLGGSALSSAAGCLGGTQSTGDGNDDSVRQDPSKEWSTSVESPRAIVVDAERVYVSTNWDIYGIDRTSGEIAWTYKVDEPSDAICYTGNAMLSDGIIYASTCDELFAIDVADGEMRWEDTSPPISSLHPWRGHPVNFFISPGKTFSPMTSLSGRWRGRFH